MKTATSSTTVNATVRRSYSKPKLAELGDVKDVVKTNTGTGADGGVFTDDTAS